MSVIPLPDDKFRTFQPRLVQPTQVNRSEFTSGRQVMQLPGAAYWMASVEHVPIVGESGIRPWRAFLTKLKGQANTFYLPATEGQQTSYKFLSASGVMPNNTIGVAINGRTLTKTVGGAAWDASAWTSGANFFNGGARAMFSAGQTDKAFMIGLTSDFTNPSNSPSNANINYAMYAREDGQLEASELGGVFGPMGPYTTGDVLGVVYHDAGVNSSVTWYRNGEALRKVTTAAGRNFYLDSSFFSVGAVANNVMFAGQPDVFGGTTAGETSVEARLLPPNATAALAGQYMTALLYGGGAQLVTITEDAAADGAGIAMIKFEPMLRKDAFALVTDRPFAQMAMDSPELGYTVDPGGIYGFGFSATEAF